MYKKRTNRERRQISNNECIIYQLIESCLKLDLDPDKAIQAINVILKKCKYLFDRKNRTVRIKKMDYRNYMRYMVELKKMSPVHQERYKQTFENDLDYINPEFQSKTKAPEIRQLENLLFLLNKDDENVLYYQYKKDDTDLLILKALIYLDEKYIF